MRGVNQSDFFRLVMPLWLPRRFPAFEYYPRRNSVLFDRVEDANTVVLRGGIRPCVIHLVRVLQFIFLIVHFMALGLEW